MLFANDNRSRCGCITLNRWTLTASVFIRLVLTVWPVVTEQLFVDTFAVSTLQLILRAHRLVCFEVRHSFPRLWKYRLGYNKRLRSIDVRRIVQRQRTFPLNGNLIRSSIIYDVYIVLLFSIIWCLLRRMKLLATFECWMFKIVEKRTGTNCVPNLIRSKCYT